MHFLILDVDDRGPVRDVELLLYVPVPAGSNSAGVPWSTVAVRSMHYKNRRYGGGTQAVVPIDSAVQAQLDSGAVYERRWTTSVDSALTDAQALASLRSQINAAEAGFVAEFRTKHRYFGREDQS